MTNFIPIFPLNIVVFPDENVNLHIFEPKYKQLIKDLFGSQSFFGIPTVLNKSLKEFGTTVQILSIEKEYENGEYDIKTRGVEVFKMIEMIPQIPDKLYSGAIVNYPNNVMDGIDSKMKKIMTLVRDFHQLLGVEKKYQKESDELNTYDIAHHIGLSLEEEYEFMSYLREAQRQEFVERHLKKMILMIDEMQKIKKRIQMNGHFRKLSIDNID